MLKITKEAVEQVQDELANMKTNLEDPFIRLSMILGWGGSRLQLSLEEAENEGDTLVALEGIKFLIPSYQARFFEGVTLDYEKGSFGGEYKLRYN